MKKIVLTTIIITLLFFNVFSQSITRYVIATAGDYYENNNISLSWTLGEIATETYINNDLILTQGFQQPELLAVKISETQENIFNLYPNPVNEILNINWNNIENKKIIIQITDVSAKIIYRKEIPSSDKNYKINFSNFSAGQYQLLITTSDNTFSSIYKITKIK